MSFGVKSLKRKDFCPSTVEIISLADHEADGNFKACFKLWFVNQISEKWPDTQTVRGFMIAHHNLET